MWSSARDDMKDAHWAPNHFAPVVYLVAAVTPSVVSPVVTADLLQELSPVLQLDATCRRRRQVPAIVTSTPYKRTLEEKEQKQNTGKSKPTRKLKMPPKSQDTVDSTVDTAVDTTSYKCIICCEDFADNWIRCCVCLQWAHEECASVTDPLTYTCDLCV